MPALATPASPEETAPSPRQDNRVRLFFAGLALGAFLVPSLRAGSRDERAALDLAITGMNQAENGDLALVAKCSFAGAPAGVGLTIGHAWSKTASAGMYRGEAHLSGHGEESRLFLKALAETLGKKAPEGNMRELTLTAVLNGNPATISSIPVWIELVHGNAARPDYVEFYVYLDLKGRRLQFRESDPRYRDPLLKLLAASGMPAKPPPEIDVSRATLADYQRAMPDRPELAAYEYRLQKKINEAYFEEMREWHFSGGAAPGSQHSFALKVLVLSDGRLGADADDLKRVTRDEPVLAAVATRAIGRITDRPESFSPALKKEIGPSFSFQLRFWQR